MLCLLILNMAIYVSNAENIQYAFAHKCNDPSVLGSILAAGVNAIEIDVCYDDKFDNKWYVSHMTLGICKSSWSLTSWLTKLKNELDTNPAYANQLAMVWLDIKTPGDSHMNELPSTVEAITSQIPSQLKILYDLTDFNSQSKNGFQQIKNLLNSNEGISFCVGGFCSGDLHTIEDVNNYYKTEGFERGTINHGAVFNFGIRDEILEKANLYDFKLVLVWTIDNESDMKYYMDPTNPASTNGQIIGDAQMNELITMFQNVSNTLGAMLATANDNPFCDNCSPIGYIYAESDTDSAYGDSSINRIGSGKSKAMIEGISLDGNNFGYGESVNNGLTPASISLVISCALIIGILSLFIGMFIGKKLNANMETEMVMHVPKDL